jgi:ankyrin repeat protein
VRSDAREVVDQLIAAGANPNAQDVDGWTPLFSAQSKEAIETLLRAGARPEISDQIGGLAAEQLKDPLLINALPS